MDNEAIINRCSVESSCQRFESFLRKHFLKILSEVVNLQPALLQKIPSVIDTF